MPPDPAQGGKSVNWELGDGQAPKRSLSEGLEEGRSEGGDAVTIIDCTLARDGSNKVGGGIITGAMATRLPNQGRRL